VSLLALCKRTCARCIKCDLRIRGAAVVAARLKPMEKLLKRLNPTERAILVKTNPEAAAVQAKLKLPVERLRPPIQKPRAVTK